MQHGAAVLRRLIDPWLSTKRTVCADSYFASVDTAQMLGRVGMRFIGIVKNATRQFPKDFLSKIELSYRGQSVYMKQKMSNWRPRNDGINVVRP